MQYLLGIIGALIGGLFFFRTKAKSAEALNDNVKTKSAINDLQVEINKDANDVETEQRKIESDKSKLVDAKKETLTNEKLSDFFSNYRKP